jgi:hypothetical protein
LCWTLEAESNQGGLANKKPRDGPNSPPTGLSRLLRSHLPARVPTCVGTSALLLYKVGAIRFYDLHNNPDGAPLCPVAYPLLASFLVTATTRDGASSPVTPKCRSLKDPCQVLGKFSSRPGKSLEARISSSRLRKGRPQCNPISGSGPVCREHWIGGRSPAPIPDLLPWNQHTIPFQVMHISLACYAQRKHVTLFQPAFPMLKHHPVGSPCINLPPQMDMGDRAMTTREVPHG